MPTRTKKERARAAMRAIAACALAAALALPGAAFADTSLGIRVYDGAQTPGSGDGTTALGIKVTSPTYTITWDANGGAFPSGTPSTTQVKWGAATTAPGTPTKAGYTFKGWSETKGGAAATLPASTTAAATWYAAWSPVAYAIAYDLDGGAASNPATYTVETAAFTLSNPSKAGWTFTGWSGTGLTGEANTSVTIPKGSTGNRSYTAHWKLNEYQVAFDANGGTGAMSAQTFQHGVAQNLKQNKFARSGYEFLGWSESKTAAEPQYQDKASLTVAGAKTLYAVWRSLSYTVAFDKNGGEGDMAPMDMVVGQKKALAANSFTRTGYTFKEWNTKPDGSGAPYADGAEIDFASATAGSEVKLYAQWALQVVCDVPTAAAVTVDASGAVTGEDQEFVSGSAAPLEVSAVKSARLAGAESVFADATTLSGVRVTLTPPASAGSPVQVPLATSANGQPAGFAIPTKGKLSVSFGLSIPANAKLSFVETAAEVAQLTYVIGAASSQP